MSSYSTVSKTSPQGVTTLNVAKRLLDYGFPCPDNIFPAAFPRIDDDRAYRDRKLETLDEFIEVMHKVAKEARENPDMVKNAPLTTPISHPDETGAAKNPILPTVSSKQNNNA